MVTIEETNPTEILQTDAQRVPFSPDMFYAARDTVRTGGRAVACDADGSVVCTLGWQPSTYLHAYAYTGVVDPWLLNEYDCLLLNGCNEYSVELCRTALPFWTGECVILVGKHWSVLLPQLPELQGFSYFCEETPDAQRLSSLVAGRRLLSVMYGLPHGELLDRYEQGILYYDEVMALTFLFSDQRELGTAHGEETFCVIDPGMYGNLGLFALFGKAVACARYVKSRGFVPVIRIANGAGGIYQNAPGDDVWQKFFRQPERSLEEAERGRQVVFTPPFYNGSVMDAIMERAAGDTALTWADGIYSEALDAYIQERRARFLPFPEQTLGVLARGTDYAVTRLNNHAIHATKEMLADKIDEILEQWGLHYIYLATEDAGYCAYFRERYGDRLYYTDQERFAVVPGKKLADLHRQNSGKRDGFLLGAEYALSIRLLAECRSLVASGGCAGLGEALRQNDGQYEHTYVFQLGTNTTVS